MKEVHPMKFVVEVARFSIFGRNGILTRRVEFTHAVDAYRSRAAYLARVKGDPRLISAKIIPVKG